MPATASPEATAIAAAYQDHLKTLFIMLCTNLEQGKPEEQSVQQFTKGYNLAKHANDLAMRVVGMSPAKAAVATRRKKTK
jgi:hypothetical protein